MLKLPLEFNVLYDSFLEPIVNAFDTLGGDGLYCPGPGTKVLDLISIFALYCAPNEYFGILLTNM